MTDGKSLKQAKEQNEKLVYFITGIHGSGKTVLANQLKNKLGDNTIIFEDFDHLNRNQIKEIQFKVSAVRHTKNKIIITTHYSKTIPKGCSFENRHIVWILTSLSSEEYSNLIELGLSKYYMKKLYQGWKNVLNGKRKTRPYLTITLSKNPKKYYQIEYGYHRYKLQELQSCGSVEKE